MKKLIICLFVVHILIFTSNAAVIYAIDTSHKFDERYEYTAVATARSPARTSGGADDYIRVTQKCAQPRNDGSSPHRGADMTMDAYIAVYPIFPGVITYIDDDTSDQEANIVINSDINGDGNPDGVYICYMHINPLDTLNLNAFINSNVSVGEIDIRRTGGYDPHLHLQWRDASSSAAGHIQKLTLLYKHVSEYSNGADFDYINNAVVIASTNTLYIKGYAKNQNNRILCSSMNLYYKVGSSNWSNTPVQMSVYLASSYIFSYNFSSLPGATTGTEIKYYIVGKRNDLTVSYNYGIWPQYYCVPPETPTDFTAAGVPVIYSSITIQ